MIYGAFVVFTIGILLHKPLFLFDWGNGKNINFRQRIIYFRFYHDHLRQMCYLCSGNNERP